MTTATAAARVSSADFAEKKRSQDYDFYLATAQSTAADANASMNADDAEELYAVMGRLGYDPELFEGDVEAFRSRNAQTIAIVDQAAEDADALAFLKILKARAEKRTAQQPQRKSKSVPLTVTAADERIGAVNDRLRTLGEILALLKQELHVRRDGEFFRDVGAVPRHITAIASEKQIACAMQKALRAFEQCNPRLYAGAVGDKRPAWDFGKAADASAQQGASGGCGVLGARTEFEIRVTGKGE